MHKTMSPKQIVEYLDRFVAGQTKAKQDLAVLGFMQWMRKQADIKARNSVIELTYEKETEGVVHLPVLQRTIKLDGTIVEETYLPPDTKARKSVIEANLSMSKFLKTNAPAMAATNGLIMGPTGCGKTYLVSLLAEYLGLPFVHINAMDITPTGYVGMSLFDAVEGGLEKAKSQYSEDELQYAIIFIDEFDKRCMGLKHDGWNTSIQNGMLAAVEGKPLASRADKDKEVYIITSRFMFIFGGSFDHVRQEKESKSKGIGYSADVHVSDRNTYNYTNADLTRNGMIKELAGRISIATEVLKLTKEEMKETMQKERGPLDLFSQLYGVLNMDFSLTEEEIDAILAKCLESDTGARGVKAATFQVLKDKITKLEFKEVLPDETKLLH